METDYRDLFEELQEEIDDGVLTPSDTIQILRENGRTGITTKKL